MPKVVLDIMKIKCFFLLYLIICSTHIFASGGMEKLEASDKVTIIETLKTADEVCVYTFWSANIENDFSSETISAKIYDLDSINILIESISFESVPVAECGFDYTLLFFKDNQNIFDSPVRINLKCNNISFYWKDQYFVSGIRNIDSIRELLAEL